MSANAREAKILETYAAHGAKLVDAHGVLTGTKARVPADTVVMFLTEPGYCILMFATRKVSTNFFESRRGLENFFRSGGNRRNYKHVSDILKRTHFAGQEYLDMFLEFKDPEAKAMGFIRKLPLTRRNLIANFQQPKAQMPTFAETTGPLVHGSTLKLSTVLKRGGPGVYVISACRVSPHARGNLPRNTPHPSKYPWIKPVARPKSGTIASLIKSIPKSSAKPGVKKMLYLTRTENRNYKILKEMASLKKYAQPRSTNNKIRNVLNHMTRENPVNLRNMRASNNATLHPANFNRTRRYMGPLPANTEPRLFQFTLGVLSNKSKAGYVFKKLPWREKAEFVAYPSRRGFIIYRFLKRHL